MVAYLNRVTIIGNVCNDPEMRFGVNGTAITTFSVAVNHRFMKDGQPVSESEFFNVVAYAKLAENCNKFLNKGTSVYIEGRYHTRKWRGQDGQEHSKVELIASNAISLDKRPAPAGSAGKQDDASLIDDIPF
jgi:single-strand DNA-binding protein